MIKKFALNPLWILMALNFLAGVLTFSACSSTGVVGGTCQYGLSVCGQSCVDLAQDVDNCGSCSNSCSAGEICAAGNCILGSIDGGSAGDAGNDAGTAGSGNSSGAGGVSGSAGSGGSTACIPPYNTAERCGDCTSSCSGSTPFCASDGSGSYSCVGACSSTTTLCGDSCVDLDSDPQHCGDCPTLCPTGICQAGICVGSSPGHGAAICMSYEQQVNDSPQSRLLGNALFASSAQRVRILVYQENANQTSSQGLRGAITNEASSRGRSFTWDILTDESMLDIALQRSNFDAFLIADQSLAASGELGTLGSNWSSAVDDFAQNGGVVVVTASSSGRNEMNDFVSGLGWFTATSVVNATNIELYNRAPGNVLGFNVAWPFVGLYQSCTWQGLTAPAIGQTFVVTDVTSTDPTLGNPAVVHVLP